MIDTHCHLADEVFEPDLDARDRPRAGGGARRRDVHPRGGGRGRGARGPARCGGVECGAVCRRRASASGASAQGRPGHADALDSRRARPDGAPWRSAKSAWTTTTTSRRATSSATVFVEQLGDCARAWACPSSFIRARRTRTRLRCWRPKARASAACSTALPAASIARGRALDLGFHLSLAGIVTFPKATDLHEVAAFVPEDRLLIETDSPFLAPVPHRGKRNEPAWVSHVVDAAGDDSRRMLARGVVELTTRNALQLFGTDERLRALTPRAQVCCDWTSL